MASSQAKPAKSETESGLRLLRNPLKLRQQKEPIVGAEGHVFDAALICGHCGRAWADQRAEPTRCGDPVKTEEAGPPEAEAVPEASDREQEPQD